MTDVFCSVESCRYRISNICTKDAIQIDENEFDFQDHQWTEKICEDFEENNMINSGRFESKTKTKIETPFGNILKVTTYPVDEEPYTDYKIRKLCSICKMSTICMCFNNDNSNDPLEDAIKILNRHVELTCDNPKCICEFMKKNKPEIYEKLSKKYGKDDIWSICEELREKYYQEDDDGLFCEV